MGVPSGDRQRPAGVGSGTTPVPVASLRVLAAPAYRNRASNPYTALLYGAMAATGATVVEASAWAVFRRRYDIVHIHWPEYLFSGPSLARAVAQSIAFAGVLAWLRTRRVRVVWTVHNLAAHDRHHRRLERVMWTGFTRRVDGVISLSEGGREAALARFPALAARPGFVIPHGHYRDVYPGEGDRVTARAVLGLPRGARVVGFLGAIRPYKGVPVLIEAFRRVSDPDWRLVIAGHAHDRVLGTRVHDAARADDRIRLDLGFVPPDRIRDYLGAADLIVLPYREVLNSGSALLALSFGRPVLVPDMGAMADLRAVAGEAWVRTYAGPLTAETLVAAMAWADSRRPDERPALDALDWSRIGRQTRAAYDAVLAVPPAGPGSPRRRGPARPFPAGDGSPAAPVTR